MSKIVVLGAGIAGHTAASQLRKKLGKQHEVRHRILSPMNIGSKYRTMAYFGAFSLI